MLAGFLLWLRCLDVSSEWSEDGKFIDVLGECIDDFFYCRG